MDKTVLITGGNKGIGLETTKIFLKNNYKVIVIARDFNSFIFNDNKNVHKVKFDISDIEGIPKLIDELGGVDVLVNNAGVMYSIPYDKYPSNKINEIIKINITAPVTLINECSKYMVKKAKGRIINVASIAGEIGHPDVWYGITKAGIINATKSYAKILGPKGVVVNSVAPGPVETKMLESIPESRKKDIKGSVYTGRFARPEEVAETIFWLGTESPEYINGICIDINNGAFPR